MRSFQRPGILAFLGFLAAASAPAGDCGHDAECKAASYCDQTAQRCVASTQCSDDKQCGSGFACDGARSTCVPARVPTFALPLDLTTAVRVGGIGCDPPRCQAPRVTAEELRWRSPKKDRRGLAGILLELPLPEKAGAARTLAFDYRLEAAGPLADGATQLTIGGAKVLDRSFVRSAAGRGHVEVALPPFEDRVRIGVQAIGPSAAFEIAGLTLTDATPASRLEPAPAGDDEPRDVEVVAEILVPCTIDILAAPARIGLSLETPGGEFIDGSLTHTRTIRQAGAYRTVERYATVMSLRPGPYRPVFFDADFGGRLWSFGTPYATTAACGRGERVFGGRAIAPLESVVSPVRSPATGERFPLHRDSALLVLYPVAQPGPSGLPPDAALALPTPICPPDGCR